MSGKYSRVKTAEMNVQCEKWQKELEKELEVIENKSTNKRIVELWTSFNEMSMEMSKAEGKMNFKEIQALTVTEFYQLKTWLQKKRTTTKSNEG